MSEDARDKTTKGQPKVEGDAPLQLEPDGEEERHPYRAPWREMHSRAAKATGMASADQHVPAAQAPARQVSAQQFTAPQGASHETAIDELDLSAADHPAMRAEAGHMSDILHWALDSIHEPALAAADWLARDIDPDQQTASALLSNPKIGLAQVKQAKSVFKTMRIVGEKSADRRIGARMYAAAIAAGLVRHGKLITRQSDEALRRGFQGLLDDHRMPNPLRDLAGMALCALADGHYEIDAKEAGKHRRHARHPLPPPPPPNSGRGYGRGRSKR